MNYGKKSISFTTPMSEENKVLERLDGSYKAISEMKDAERAFLNALILRNKPVKLLEIGVSAGGSSIVMLNAIKDFPEAKLYSIDVSANWFKDKTKKTGYFVANYPELQPQWQLFTGGLSLKFLETIGSEIDFCLIDTMHINPGEIFDFLFVLPFLGENAVVVFHDISLHVEYFFRKKYRLVEKAITTDLLMSAISGHKYLPDYKTEFTEYGLLRKSSKKLPRNDEIRSYEKYPFPNIGAIKIDSSTGDNVFAIFNLLKLRWRYMPSAEQEQDILQWLDKFYDEYYVDYVKKVFAYQKKVIAKKYIFRWKEIFG
jgi:predicted O-methyltransferase YrrM